MLPLWLKTKDDEDKNYILLGIAVLAIFVVGRVYSDLRRRMPILAVSNLTGRDA